MRKQLFAALSILLLVGVSNTCVAALDTINGKVTESSTNTPIDSVDVISEGIKVKTNASGIFSLAIPGTGIMRTVPRTVSWDPSGHRFSWTGNQGMVSIEVRNLSGGIVSRYTGSDPSDRFSTKHLPQGIYLATVQTPWSTEIFKIMKIRTGSGDASPVVSRVQVPGSSAYSLLTTRSHVVFFSKTGYISDSITVAANTSTATMVTAKLVKTKSYTVLFDGTNLDNWVVNPTNSYIKDSAIYITGCWCMMWTKADYDNFRVFVTCRITDPAYTNPGSNHMGIGIWGARADNFSPTRTIEFTPQNCWIWDYVSNTGPNNASTCYAADGTGPATGWGDWHTTELLANLTDGTVKTACDGVKMTHYKEPNLSRRHKGPIGLQMHGPVPVEYKDIKIEVNPTDTNLVSVKE